VSKEVKPRELFIVLRNFRIDEDYYRAFWAKSHAENYLSRNERPDIEATTFIEYTPEVKRAVECFNALAEAVDSLATYAHIHGLDVRKYEPLIKRTKGQA
jgi:hypothetical protein